MSDTITTEVPAKRPLPVAIVVSMRPKQWIKNLFVFVPLLFSHRLAHLASSLEAVGAFALFCAAASAVYLINDVLDLETDRHHPVKRYRPLPAGEISRAAAVATAIVLALVAIMGAVPLGAMFLALVAAYVVINVAYSAGLKNIVIIDVMMIGSGFVIRVLAGVAAIGESPSHWLVLCTILLSLFLGFSKRRNELMLLKEKADRHRPVLANYSALFLDQMIAVVTAATLMCYILYTVDDRTLGEVTQGSSGLLLTVPFVLYGIFRYLYLVYHRDRGGNPTKVLLSDPMMLLDVFLWAVLSATVVYFPDYFKGWFS